MKNFKQGKVRYIHEKKETFVKHVEIWKMWQVIYI